MIYTIDASVDEPIMLLNKVIGSSYSDGINGALFQQELLQLDSMGKKRIQVWINSPGGMVDDGYNIFNAILKSKTPVDTYNTGIAASVAAVIFMAGRRRFMADYAQMMIHSPGNSTDKKQLESYGASLTTMLAARSSISEEDVKYMMGRETWLNSAECFAKGFCTDIEITKEANKKRMPATNMNEMWQVADKITNELLKIDNTKNTVMQKVTMKLGLNDAATEDNVVSAIKEIENRAYTAETNLIAVENKLTDVTNTLTKEKGELEGKVTNLEGKVTEKETELAKITNELKAMKTDKETAETASKTLEAKTMVEGYAKAGRIKNEATIIEKWTGLAVADFDGTKEMLEAITLNKVANIITAAVVNKLDKGILPTTAEGLMAKHILAGRK